MNKDRQLIGRVKTVLVSQDDSEKGIISAIVARRTKWRPGSRRLRFSGTVKFTDFTRKHIRAVILPIIDIILDTLGMARSNFEISAVNLGAASIQDVGVTISGFSADIPLLIAMLSQGLQIPVSDNFVATGHIASVDGDITAVEGIPAKAKAAKKDESIIWFIQPDLEKDESLKALFSDQRDRNIEAIGPGEELLFSKEVGNIGRLIRLVFAEENIVLAGLREGFFGLSVMLDQFNNPVQDVVSYLTCNNQKRFWDVLDYRFLSGHCEKARQLLQTYAQFFVGKQIYPKGFGARLLQLFRSVHPAIRKLKIVFPILEQGLCNELIRLARDDDNDDIPLLLDAILGRNIKTVVPIDTQPEIEAPGSESTVFDAVISLINEQTLAEKFGVIDSARGRFILESPRIETYRELIDVIEAYIVHLQRYTGSGFEIPDTDQARNEAVKLLEKTFYNKGGDKAAFVQARDGTQGGIRSILDMVTEYYKAEKQDAYIDRVLKDAIRDMTLDERVNCIRVIMKKTEQFLPEDIKNQPPKKFARNIDTLRTIILTYVRCRDKFNQSLSSM